MSVVVEICVQGVASALAAGAGGADRVELCEDLAVGGVTPSAGTIAVACRRVRVPVHVLVRPRGGDFVPTEAEYDAMRQDIETARALGAAGVVLGLLNPDRTVDVARTARLRDAARPLSVTFHRAFDETPDPFRALDALLDLGVARVLTSGGGARAVDGLERLAALHHRAAGRLTVLPGGRVTDADIPALAGAGLAEVHVGSAACLGGRTDAGRVGQIVAAARKAST